ncbi:MAG: tetratricopeptide repeat protein [Deltaproteobacteria bacterium]
MSTSPDPCDRRRQGAFRLSAASLPKLYLFIAAAAFLVYGNSLFNGFTGDDFFVVVNNDFVKSWKNLPLLFGASYITRASDLSHLGRVAIGAGELTYRPVVTLSYFFDYALWKLHPSGYHLTNLALHAANAVLLCCFVFLAAKDKALAFAAGLFFALHPVNTEAVNGIAHREDLLAFLFFAASLIGFARSGRAQAGRRLMLSAFSVAAFALAVFSKESAVSLPLVLVLYARFVEKRSWKQAVSDPRLAAYAAVCLVFFFVSFFRMGGREAVRAAYPGGSFVTNMLTMLGVCATYVRQLLAPAGLHATIPADPALVASSFLEPRVLVSASFLLVFGLIMARAGRAFVTGHFALLWLVAAALPVLNIVPMRIIMAGRFLYLPCAAFCLLWAQVLLQPQPAERRGARAAQRGLMAVTLAAYALVTPMRNSVWKSDTTLWSEVTRYYPRYPAGHVNLGQELFMAGQAEKGIAEYQTAAELDPRYRQDYFAILGNYYYRKGMLDEAQAQYAKALHAGGDTAYIHDVLGIISGRRGDYDAAIRHFKQAIGLDPKYVEAYYNMGVTYLRAGAREEARRAFEELLELNPGYQPALDMLWSIAGRS